ncbi:Phosphotransferase family protein [Rhodotorula toruloides ATCC 204091]|uniref:Phosphotransferase family protein n=1 Tax=Rhodotorula toruloides TaxID=5286 RepID=A0A0K3CCB8_RHOTO|nr:Phosphotransferase family protein [Rhodotorula toruloides ATCC 204091]PRQ76383.1 phosphotransferase family protein [Rhodotorula toruloides]
MLAGVLSILPWLADTLLSPADAYPESSSSSSSRSRSTSPSRSRTSSPPPNTDADLADERLSLRTDQLLPVEGANSPCALPQPRCVRREGKVLHGASGDFVWKVEYEGSSMIVKGGPGITKAEAEMTIFVRTRTSIPVPKVYGVVHEDDSTYIYFEFVAGVSLTSAVQRLSEPALSSVYKQLRQMLDELHAVLAPPGTVIGSLDGSNTFAFTIRQGNDSPRAFGDLTSSAALADYFKEEYLALPDTSQEAWAAIEAHLGRSSPLVLVHGDLWPSNILVSVDNLDNPFVAAIIDWENGGFYPEWVEFPPVARRALGGRCDATDRVLQVVAGSDNVEGFNKEDYRWATHVYGAF